MNILTQYRENRHRKEVTKDFLTKNGRSSGDFTGVKNVLVLSDVTDETNLKIAEKYVGRLKKKADKVQLIGYVDTKEVLENYNFLVLGKKDLNWLWKPKRAAIDNLKSQRFDLLINLCQQDCFPLEYLAVSLDANYKIGALTDYPNNYDLMLDSTDLQNYLKQVDFFLEKYRLDLN